MFEGLHVRGSYTALNSNVIRIGGGGAPQPEYIVLRNLLATQGTTVGTTAANLPAAHTNSIFAGPSYVSNPAANGYRTQQGSLARDTATPVSPAVSDPLVPTYCDDPTPSEGDGLVEPDIGAAESCS